MIQNILINIRKTTLVLVGMLLAIMSASPAMANGGNNHAPQMRLSLEAPDATFVRHRRRNGILTIDYKNRGGILSTTQWPLIMRLESRNAVGYVKEFITGQNREALVLRDPDDCLVLTSLIDDLPLGRTVFDIACDGLPEDETYLEVQTEKFDTFEFSDKSNTGNDSIQTQLVDDDCADPPETRNVACLQMANGKLQTVGPKTGEQVKDGYGYGTDDDASSMVVMFDIGGARVFDPITFDLVPGTLRNMAGLINTVSAELLTGSRRTAITMTTHTLAGYAEPIAIFDFSVSDPQYAGYNALLRVDSGPIIPFNFVSDFPANNDNSSAEFNPFYEEIMSAVYPIKATLRAVAVAGEAPAFIEDWNYDGIYTAADLVGTGYTLVSNEIKTNVRVINDNLLVETDDPKCPPRTFLFLDLDGDMISGAPMMKCTGTSSSTRTRRIPR